MTPVASPRSGPGSWLWSGERWLIAIALVLTVGFLGARLVVLETREFDPDELEHMHVAWYIGQGEVPYRDFYEVHTPLFHYTLSILVSSLQPERSAADGMQTLVTARRATWLVSVSVIAATFLLARRVQDATTAWVALPIVASEIVLALRGVEIRPDGLSTLLWLSCLIFLDRAIHPASGSAGSRVAFAASGCSIGLAVLTSQKLLLAGPPLALILGWYCVSPRFGGTLVGRLSNAAWLAACVLLMWGVALAYFAARGAAGAFVHYALVGNLVWKRETSAESILAFLLQYDPWLFGLAASGACLLAYECVRAWHRGSASRAGGVEDIDRAASRNFMLVIATAGVFTGLFIIPVPYAQYCLSFMPLFAILGAAFLVRLARSLGPGWWVAAGRMDRAALGLATGIALGLAAVGLGIAQPRVVHPFVYPVVVAVGALGFVFLSRTGRSHAALAAAVVMLSVYPAQWTRWMQHFGDNEQFASLRYVLANSGPDAVVMDGWTGYGVFRRHAWFYWMLHPGVRAMLPEGVTAALAEDLVSMRVKPDIVVLDPNLRALSADVTSYVESHYQPSGLKNIYVRTTTSSGRHESGAAPR